jgi:hypothetical protein
METSLMYRFTASPPPQRNDDTSATLYSSSIYILAMMITLLGACSEDPTEDAPPSAGQSISDGSAGIEAGEMNAGEMSAGEVNAGEVSGGERLGGDSAGGDETAGEAMAGVAPSGVEVEAGEMLVGGSEVDPNRPPEDQDLDEDGLDDRWEWSAGDASRLDWTTADTDGDGTPDGDEDEDGDGLTASEEWAVESYRRALYSEDQAPARVVDGGALNPLRPDLIIELDEMEGRSVSAIALDLAVDAFDVALSPLTPQGIGIHFFRDEALPVSSVGGDFESRHQLLASAPPRTFPEGFPVHQLIHVIASTARTDDGSRGGEVVGHPDDLNKTGVIIYQDTLAALHPRCGLDDPPPVPFVELDEAQAGALIHELGHALQLGHDTEINGGVNPWNVMAVVTGCVSARQRFHGEGNDDVQLGSTEMISRSRFSGEAIMLMRFQEKLSVDRSELLEQGQGLVH